MALFGAARHCQHPGCSDTGHKQKHRRGVQPSCLPSRLLSRTTGGSCFSLPFSHSLSPRSVCLLPLKMPRGNKMTAVMSTCLSSLKRVASATASRALQHPPASLFPRFGSDRDDAGSRHTPSTPAARLPAKGHGDVEAGWTALVS